MSLQFLTKEFNGKHIRLTTKGKLFLANLFGIQLFTVLSIYIRSREVKVFVVIVATFTLVLWLKAFIQAVKRSNNNSTLNHSTLSERR
jgi:hypothetical protein